MSPEILLGGISSDEMATTQRFVIMTALHGLSTTATEAVLNSLRATRKQHCTLVLSGHSDPAVLYCLLTTLGSCPVLYSLASTVTAPP